MRVAFICGADVLVNGFGIGRDTAGIGKAMFGECQEAIHLWIYLYFFVIYLSAEDTFTIDFCLILATIADMILAYHYLSLMGFLSIRVITTSGMAC